MGLDIYFYRVKLVDTEDLNKTMEKMGETIKKGFIRRQNNPNNLIKYLNKKCASSFYWEALTEKIKSGSEITKEEVDKLKERLFAFRPTPRYDFYARKEWWIPEYMWSDGEEDYLVLVSDADLDYFICQYEETHKNKDKSILNLSYDGEWNEWDEDWCKRQLKSLKKLKKSLKSDEVVLALFSA